MSAPDSAKIDLLACSPHGGCSAKLSPKDLEALVGRLPAFAHPDLLVGVETHDDAAAFRISEDKALVFTTDFFPPVCSDAETFGRIAAANALSDVYAMGGEPLLALNIVGFSPKELPFETYASILRGGAEKVAEAGALLVGGHTIDDHPPKYGLAVVGLAHPDHLVTNAGARPGQRLLLTKPLGTGVLCAAHRLGLGEPTGYERALAQMSALNRNPSRAAVAAELSDTLALYSGNDDQIVPIMSLGGIGVISVLSNIMPKETHDMCRRMLDGDVRGAAALQLGLLRLINALFCEVNPIPVKTACAMMGLDSGELLPNLVRAARYAIILFIVIGIYPKVFPVFEKIRFGKK